MWASHVRGCEYIIQQACFCSFPPSCESLIELSKLRSGGKQRLWCKVKDLHSSIVQWSQVPVKSDSNVCVFFFFSFSVDSLSPQRCEGEGWMAEEEKETERKKDGVSYTKPLMWPCRSKTICLSTYIPLAVMIQLSGLFPCHQLTLLPWYPDR